MKMPGSNSADGGYYPFDDSPYIFEGVQTVTENGTQNRAPNDYNQVSAENDFSEYMWMEHMEEFDREVMRKLEEEELMEECIEAMLEDEIRGRSTQPTTNNTGTAPSTMLSNMQLNNSLEAVKTSTLNPLAAEFVPGKQSEPVDCKTKTT